MREATSQPAGRPRMSLKKSINSIVNAPVHAWALAAFGLAYLLFLVGPVFLRTNQMEFYRYVEAGNRIGIDLKLTLSWSEYWLHGGVLPDKEGTIYPPVASMLFIPLLAFRFAEAYRLVTVATVLAFAFATLVLPGWMTRQKGLSIVAVLVAATGLVSYGLQFELERGQFSVLTIVLTLLAVWLFQAQPRWRMLAYVLFVAAVQLKIYPFIFLPLFISDWRQTWVNVRRLGLLSLVNAALLFVTGIDGFRLWLAGVRGQDIYVWNGNASAYSFAVQVGNFAAARGWNWVQQGAPVLSILALVAIGICLALILLGAYRRNQGGLSMYFILGAAIACILVPASGSDYRLSALGGPLVMVLLVEGAEGSPGRGGWRRLLVFVLSFAYAVTLFPPVQRPFELADSFPALSIMLVALTVLALTSARTMEPVAEGIAPEGAGTGANDQK